MELEALLLGIEPLTAVAVGVGAVILAPVVNAASSAMKDSKLGEALSESASELTKSAKELTKDGLIWGFEAFENAQATYAQAEEAFRDLVADAKVDHMGKKSESKTAEPQKIEIESH